MSSPYNGVFFQHYLYDPVHSKVQFRAFDIVVFSAAKTQLALDVFVAIGERKKIWITRKGRSQLENDLVFP